MSFKADVLGIGETEYVSNSLRFATEIEAGKYGNDIFSRWTGCKKVQVVPSDDPVNYRWSDETGLSAIPRDPQ